MSYVKYGVPSHEPAGLQTGSRIFGAHRPRLSVALDLTLQIDTVGTARPRARVISGREAHFSDQRLLESRRFFYQPSGATGSVTLDITLSIDSAGAAGSPPSIPRVYRAKDPEGFPSPEAVSRSYGALDYMVRGALDLQVTIQVDSAGAGSAPVLRKVYQSKDPEGFRDLLRDSRVFFPLPLLTGSATLPITLTIDTSGAASGPAAQIPKVYRAKDPAGWVDVDPVSRPYTALDGRIAGSADLPITLTISTAGTAGGAVVTRLGIAIPGQGNVGLRTRGVEQEPTPGVEFGSRGFIYYNAAPPIYRVIIPGGTNQGFQFVGIPRDPVVVPASKLVKGYASGIVQRSVDLGLTIAIDTLGAARPRASIHRAKDPHYLLQRELDSRLFHRPRVTYTGSVTLPVTVGISAAGIAKTYGAATLGLILNMAATVPVGWTLVVMEEDNSLTLQILPVESTQNLSVSLEDNTLTLTVMEEQDS